MSYPRIHITEGVTTVPVTAISGTISFQSTMCEDDTYNSLPYTGPDRGICLLAEITAKVTFTTPGNDSVTVDAVPFYSSGTSSSQFVIIQANQDKTSPVFEVTLVTE